MEESEETELVNNLYDAFDNNKSFLLQELSREGPYEINIQDINVDNNNDIIIEIEESLAVDGTVQESPTIFQSPQVPLKKAAQFRWKKAFWTNPETSFSETYPTKNIKLPVEYFFEYFTEDFLQQTKHQ